MFVRSYESESGRMNECLYSMTFRNKYYKMHQKVPDPAFLQGAQKSHETQDNKTEEFEIQRRMESTLLVR